MATIAKRDRRPKLRNMANNGKIWRSMANYGKIWLTKSFVPLDIKILLRINLSVSHDLKNEVVHEMMIMQKIYAIQY